MRDALYGNTATTSTKAAPSFNSQARDIYDENEVSLLIYNKLKVVDEASFLEHFVGGGSVVKFWLRHKVAGVSYNYNTSFMVISSSQNF